MLLGLIRPTSGEVRLFGRAPGQRGHLDGVGALVEGPAFYPYLSGRDNLRVLARHARVPRDRVTAVLDRVGLTGRAGDRFGMYSLGMKQRSGVAAALLKDPRLVVLDEPTNGLDPAGMADMRLLVRRLGAAGCTVLLSSHLMAEVQELCDRVGVVAGGRLIAESTVAGLRGGRTLRIVAAPLEAAAAVVRDRCGPDAVRVCGDGLDVAAAPRDAAALNAALVAAGVAVSELTSRERGLEQAFLELTRTAGSHV